MVLSLQYFPFVTIFKNLDSRLEYCTRHLPYLILCNKISFESSILNLWLLQDCSSKINICLLLLTFSVSAINAFNQRKREQKAGRRNFGTSKPTDCEREVSGRAVSITRWSSSDGVLSSRHKGGVCQDGPRNLQKAPF